jgi:hypothetical protein
VHDETSIECPLMVSAETPSVEATSRTWRRKEPSSIDKSSLNGSRIAGITPLGWYFGADMPTLPGDC